MDEFESAFSVLVDLGDNAHMSNALVDGAAAEEHQVAGSQVTAVNTASVVDLGIGAAVQIEAKLLEDVAGESRAVKTSWRCLSIAIGHTPELEGIAQQVAHDTAVVLSQRHLLELFGHGTAFCVRQHLCLCVENPARRQQ